MLPVRSPWNAMAPVIMRIPVITPTWQAQRETRSRAT